MLCAVCMLESGRRPLRLPTSRLLLCQSITFQAVNSKLSKVGSTYCSSSVLFWKQHPIYSRHQVSNRAATLEARSAGVARHGPNQEKLVPEFVQGHDIPVDVNKARVENRFLERTTTPAIVSPPASRGFTPAFSSIPAHQANPHRASHYAINSSQPRLAKDSIRSSNRRPLRFRKRRCHPSLGQSRHLRNSQETVWEKRVTWYVSVTTHCGGN
ncbi:hypothetical protein QBC41DRAFT_152312 [Cercophora samala]|uniref:Uncharacterized protein n=1 Tax=Cercophora samala TaxID=330535 RepID=A0AA39ZKX2_9PEZI|nr:hypothetical protein QBC41DRAFT_152312 [Cercophora samala]